VGVLVANVGTLASVSRALDGKPVTRKMITVTGEVRRPAVLDVPIGTPLAACLEMCGGSTARDPVYLVGGPMMGRLIEDSPTLDRTPVTKTSGGLVVLPRGHFLHVTATLSADVMRRRAATACIQCRYCTDLCPRYLVGHQFETHRVMRAFAAGDDEAQAVEQAWLCCECGVCELFACPMRLSPRRINSMLKAGFRQGGRSYAGAREIRPGQRDLRPYRKIPTTRLAMKTDIARYLDIHPEFASACSVDEVKIPLHQHTGAPAVPVVAAGDRIDAGDLIGEIPEGALGARVHASIRGVVTEVGASIVIKGA
jgi:Na+-translocating ferredoxin:NAD+ oxidoreductase RnfC subunit